MSDPPTPVNIGVYSLPPLELLIPLLVALSFFRRADGSYPHRSFLYRATTRGCLGVVLESWELPGVGRVTTRAAIERFIAAYTAAKRGVKPASTPSAIQAAEEAGERLRATVFSNSDR
jgi:hypothetical protein